MYPVLTGQIYGLEKSTKYLNENFRLCCAHFEERCLNHMKNRLLYTNAVPTFFINNTGARRKLDYKQCTNGMSMSTCVKYY